MHGKFPLLDADHELDTLLVGHGDLAGAQVAGVLLVRVLAARPPQRHVLQEATQPAGTFLLYVVAEFCKSQKRYE